MITERIVRLKDNQKKYAKQSENTVRDKAYLYAMDVHKDKSVILQHAHGFAEALKRKDICIPKYDLLAGYLHQYTYNTNFPMIVSPEFDPAKRAKFQMDVRREVNEYKELFGCEDTQIQRDLDEFADAVEAWLIKHWHSGHTIAGYPELLEKGFAGIYEEANAEGQSCKIDEERDAIKAFLIVLDACEDYIERYQHLAERLYEDARDEGDGEREKECLKMADALSHIKTRPPRSFFEALQLLYLAHEMMYVENVPSAISLGRLDYYLYPFYERDIRDKVITKEAAIELLQDFWLKCSVQVKAYQNVTLGGCDEDGKCSVNELTYICLEISKELKVDQPSVNYRWTEDQPGKAWDAVLDLMRTGMGFPAIMYDPCCIRAQMNRGIDRRDVWNYGFVGCVELGIPGKENALTEMARLNLPKLLNIMLRGGKDIVSGKSFCMNCDHPADEIASFEMLYKMYLLEVAYWIRKILANLRWMEELYAEKYPLPYLSILTRGCIRDHRDVNAGGAIYHSVGVNLCGMATMADSLEAIRQIVFEERKMTLGELVEILENDYRDHEGFQKFVRGKLPKYGNDIPYVDKYAVEIEELVSNILEEHKTTLGGAYRLGLYSVEDHSIMGMYTGATANGRKAGETLSNSTGATQGSDINGPTALINSVTGFPMDKAWNGMVMDLRFSPEFLEEATGQNALKKMIETYFHKGGMEVQVSAVSGKTLIDAQKNPDQYRDLIVRVSGFSAYFCSLRKTTQDDIIKRTVN